MTNSTDWRHPRPITKRLIISGDLVLQSAAHFGSGDAEPLSPIDMLLLRDPLTKKPLLPGSSIAGALLLIVFPHKALKGYLGLELGGLTPVFVVLLNAVWGITAAWWLSMLGED